MSKSLYLIDGHYQIYRAFYAAPKNLSAPDGQPTGAIHIFCQMLLNLIRDRQPDYLAMMMDVSDRTVFRCQLDADYKANREPAPEALHSQAEHIVSIVQGLDIPLHRMEGFEADDLMATIAHQVSDRPIDVYLVSRDKDLEQLLSDRVRLFDPTKEQIVDPATLLDTKGYSPSQAVEIQTLTGDSTDNIPGVEGIGVKTAAKLIAKYQTAQGVLDHADSLTPKQRERVLGFAEQMPITRQLVTLRRDVPFTFELDPCAVHGWNPEKALPILDELGLVRLRDQIKGVFQNTESQGTQANDDAVQTVHEDVDYKLINTPDALKEFAAELARQPRFAFDTETTGLNPVAADLVGLSFSWKAGSAYYLPVRGACAKVLDPDDVVEAIKPIFEDASIGKVGHNIKYDIVVLRQLGVRTLGIAFDTMVASFVLEPLRNSHGLDPLTLSLLDHRMIPISDLIGKGKNQITIDQVDTERVCEYACEDADYTWRLLEVLESQISGSDLEPLFRDTEMPLVAVLAEMEHNGVAIDSKVLNDLGDSLADRIIALDREIQKTAGHSFNVASTKQLAAVLFDELGLEVVRKTKTGRSTDADTLQTLAASTDNPIPNMVLAYREMSKLKSTYVDTLPKMVCPRTQRIHASFHQTGAVTGRLSSSNPNLQNIPIRTELGRKIRAAFIAGDERNVLLTADYSQIELRLLAHFCQDPALLEAFHKGEDIHRAVAAQVNGVASDKVTTEQRSAAKAVNFGIIYGQTAFGLSRSLSIPVGEARAFIDMYFMRYPQIRMFIDQCISDARRDGYAETILGRRRPIQELFSRNRQQVSFGERIAVNTVVQGSAADLIKKAMIQIHAKLDSGDYSAKMVTQVHDELVFETCKSEVERESEMIRHTMETAIVLDVPIEVDIGWGWNWVEGK